MPRIIAEISGGLNCLGLALHLHFDSRVAIRRFHDLVRHAFEFFLHFVELAAHEALDGVNRIARIGDRLALGGVADQPLAGLCESHHGRRRAPPFRILQNHRLATFHDRHARVRRSQINAYYFCHNKILLKRVSEQLNSSGGAMC